MQCARMRGVAMGVGAALVGLVAGVVAAADRPSWQCVPEQTLFAVRLPGLTQFIDALKARTKLGAVVANEQRWLDFRKLLEEEAGEDWKKLTAAYEKIGVTADELWKAGSGEIGYAGMLAGTDGPYIGLFWTECGSSAATKWLAALDQKLAE